MRFKISAYVIPGLTTVITIEDIKKTVAKFYEIPVTNIDLNTRKREVVQPRQVSMFFCKQGGKGSLAVIGSKFGGKAHCTVLHAEKTVKNLYNTDKKYRAHINVLSSMLRIEIKTN